MLRKILTISILLITCFALITYTKSHDIIASNIIETNHSTSFNSLSCEEQVSEYQLMVERILYSSIEKSVNHVYGEGERTSWNYKIINIERGYYPETYLYRVTIEFETFTGAHNPPFDTNIAVYDIITFNPLVINEVSYEHHLITSGP